MEIGTTTRTTASLEPPPHFVLETLDFVVAIIQLGFSGVCSLSVASSAALELLGAALELLELFFSFYQVFSKDPRNCASLGSFLFPGESNRFEIGVRLGDTLDIIFVDMLHSCR